MTDRRSNTLRAATLALGVVLMVVGAALAAPTMWRAVYGLRSDPALLPSPAAVAAWPSPSPSPAPSSSPSPVEGPVDGVAFELAIPAIGYHSKVFEGAAIQVLDKGPGHYPTTAWPGQPGNVGVAGHNTFWTEFGRLKPGDEITITTQRASYVYRVTGSAVVSPDDRSVLAPTSDRRLTLTTCYPLWAGAFATRRLIISAVEIGGVA